MSETNRTRDEDLQELQVPVVTGLEAQTRGEIDIQISTAKRYPRSVSRVLKVKPTGTLAHLQGLVELHDGTRHAVPDGRVVVEAIHRSRKERRA